MKKQLFGVDSKFDPRVLLDDENIGAYLPGSAITMNTVPTVVRVDSDSTGNTVFSLEPVVADTNPRYLGPPILDTTTLTASGDESLQNDLLTQTNTDDYAKPLEQINQIEDHAYLGPPVLVDQTATKVIDTPAVQSASIPSWLIWLGIGIGAWLILKPKTRKQ